MGSEHAKNIIAGKVPGAELAAICDTSPQARNRTVENLDTVPKIFNNVESMFAADCIDAVIVATPHYDHPRLSILAFENGLHVLCEKPAGVYTSQVRLLNEAADKYGKIFGLMFNQRTLGIHKKIKDLIDAGDLGVPKRNSWVVTHWYRSQGYYNSGGWRASWAGEGGGVLLNQCPHQLDLWQWICGMPKRVRAFCSFGKYHDIEVEDDVTVYVEYEDGTTGTFITSTGEAPGTNRFEIAGDNGKLVMENDTLTFWRNRVPERQYNAESTAGFGAPEVWKCEIPFEAGGEAHVGVMKQWIQAIQKDDPSLLVADGREGIRSLELSNAMLLSSWTDDWVDLPIDEELFYEKLQERIKTSTYKKPETSGEALDVDGSFGT